jgi:prepilin-type N-terminal cleavage/methylation domain-containing protein
MKMKLNRKTRGFTLVELLVVISIIALLISILLPSLRGARDNAKRVICRNNLRSIWTGILMYSYEFNDRVPYLENPNAGFPGADPNADPFGPQFPLSPGNVLLHHVNQDSWRCPAAVNGYPENAGQGNWKMTYLLQTAGHNYFPKVAYDEHSGAYTRGQNDPAIKNYIHFDGRPFRLLDGRRYVANPDPNYNQNAKGYWRVRFPIIAELTLGKTVAGQTTFIYPHRGTFDARPDLGKAKEDFEKDTGASGSKKPGYYELHADGDKSEIYFTRFWNASLGPG